MDPWLGRTLVGASLCAMVAAARPPDLAAQLNGAIPSMRLASGKLSFDGHATPGDFTGTTTTVTGEMTGGASLSAVRGWVESPVKTLDTGNGKRDRDLNKSMETDKHPTMRFELTGVTAEETPADSAGVRLAGKLTLHGVTRDVVLPARVWQEGRTLRLRSTFPVDLGDYRIGGLTKLLGMLRMQEGIEVHVDLTFAPG
jgi:polyisoprenoid-binding protein YceI